MSLVAGAGAVVCMYMYYAIIINFSTAYVSDETKTRSNWKEKALGQDNFPFLCSMSLIKASYCKHKANMLVCVCVCVCMCTH